MKILQLHHKVSEQLTPIGVEIREKVYLHKDLSDTEHLCIEVYFNSMTHLYMYPATMGPARAAHLALKDLMFDTENLNDF